VFAARVLLRSRKLKDVAAMGTLLGGTAASAAVFVYSYPRMRSPQTLVPPSFTFSCVFGGALGLVYTLQHLLRCCDVLAFPFIHRHRYFRIRHSLPGALTASLQVTSLALLLAFVLKPSAAGAASSIGNGGGSSEGHSIVWFGVVLSRHLSALLTAFHAGSLWVFGWLAGHAPLSIVLTEPPRLVQQCEGAQGAAETLLKALGSSSSTLQDHTLAEFAEIAEGTTAAHASRRADIFADETGRLGWTPLAGFLVEELREFAGTLGAALSAMTGENVAAAKSSASRPPRVQWNVLSAAGAFGGAKVGKEQDRAAWSVRAKYYRVCFCLRALSGMTAASRAEDRFGVVLLCEPVLADVLASLLSTVLALQQYTKQESSFSSRSHPWLPRPIQRVVRLLGLPSHPTLQQPELCAHALEDVARTTTYRVVRTFGPSLVPLLKECRMPPALPQATTNDLARLLQGMLSHQE